MPILPHFTNLYQEVKWSILSRVRYIPSSEDGRAGQNVDQNMATQDPPPYQQEPGSGKRSRDSKGRIVVG